MNVHLSNAVRMFYSKSSFEMVYMEAIANALDAGATEICIYIVANSKDIAQSLQLKISDNGVGFTEDRFKKFSNLFDTEDAAHKGLGRLAYRFYFDKQILLLIYAFGPTLSIPPIYGLKATGILTLPSSFTLFSKKAIKARGVAKTVLFRV